MVIFDSYLHDIKVAIFETRNLLKFAGVPQTTGSISAASGPKFTILWGYVEDILLLNKFFSDCRRSFHWKAILQTHTHTHTHTHSTDQLIYAPSLKWWQRACKRQVQDEAGTMTTQLPSPGIISLRSVNCHWTPPNIQRCKRTYTSHNTLVKAKIHYAIRFEAGRRPAASRNLAYHL